MLKQVLVLNPPRVDGLPVVREERFEHKDMGTVYPPLNLLYITAMLEEKWGAASVNIIDANGRNLNCEQIIAEAGAPDIIVTRLGFDTQNPDLAVIGQLKKHFKATTIVRNKIIAESPELLAKITADPAVDIFLTAEPESAIIDLITAIAAGTPLQDVPGVAYNLGDRQEQTPMPPMLLDLDQLPFPAYHRLPDLSPYHTGLFPAPFATVTTSRGCPYRCTFCAYGQSRYRVRSPEKVVAELTWLKESFGVTRFLFFDDMISQQNGRIEEICRLMLAKKLDMQWACCTRANKIDLPALQIMKQAGCCELAVGIESGSSQMLERIAKGVTKDEIRQAAAACRQAGIHFYAMTIIGLPGETATSIQETIDFIKELKPFYTQFCFAVPFPNTEIYQYYRDNDLLLTTDWSRYSPLSPQPVVRTAELSASELSTWRMTAYKETQFFNLRYLFSQFRPTDWRWNIMGLFKLAQRVWAMICGKAVR